MSPQLEGKLPRYTTAAEGKEETARELSKHSAAGPLPELVPAMQIPCREENVVLLSPTVIILGIGRAFICRFVYP